MHLSRTSVVTVFTTALALALGLTSTAFAKEHDRPTTHRVVLNGVITGVTTTTTGAELTLDRGERDDDPADDVTVALSDTTRIAPPGAQPAVDVRARVVALRPAVDGGAFLALSIVLRVHPQPETRPLHACGTISALPDGGTIGDWTFHVSDVADYTIGVTADTRITPPRVDPAVGMRACFEARAADSGWIAKNIELKAKHNEDDDEGDDHDRARVELTGTVSGVPVDAAGTYTLTIQTDGGAHEVVVTPDTEVEGDLADGARVALRATRTTDADGNVVLTAEKIKVLGAPSSPGGEHAKDVVRIEGEITAVSADGTVWSITHDGTVTVITIGADTHIVGLVVSALLIGREVDGTATVQVDGSLLAKQLRVKRN
ncbi:MAG: hypothetical protein ABI780_06675 [Ardenticatenales bacterium]